MPGLLATLNSFLVPAFDALQPGATPGVRHSTRADLQADGALALARSLRRPPGDVARDVVARALGAGRGSPSLEEACEKVEVAGPGFINLTLRADWLALSLRSMAADPARLGASPAARQRKVVVDYASPNAAKQMHVGHLRSTIIGDCLARLLNFAGHSVVRENHIGDWGTPFGMLIEHLVDIGEDEGAHELAVGDLELFYQHARAAYDSDAAFADRARARVVALQSGDVETLRLWRILVEQSIDYFDGAFRRLGTTLRRDDVVGESSYEALLPGVVSSLGAKGLLVENAGALCVFPPGYFNREGQPLPLIVQKSDGGYTYAATDLAAVRDRVERQRAELLVYVVGLPQSRHLEMVFSVARLAGWLPPGTEAVHVGFGNVLGPDGKMFRSREAREGGTVKLVALLDEAEQRAAAVISGRGEMDPLAPEEREGVARAVGVGAVKYADLSTDRIRDYRFDWDRMLAFDGNTGPYLQYAHARIRSIFRRARLDPLLLPKAIMAPGEREERQLAKRLLSFGDAVDAGLQEYAPHKLCSYLFELASSFTDFYENCPVLRAPSDALRSSRLGLCAVAGQVLEKGLSLLGIEAPERM
ncbi:MAG TPA: arginine--tRNA ligase [Acidimicrobiales bacterium]|nr:arginine--tRNA ligase [Acidimicrobiales bacterium]